MSDLFVPVCSIAPTKRRRFLWAAWWSGPPSREPFRKPDASSGGARTREEALAEAEKAAGAKLVEIEAVWAKAWTRVLRGEPAFFEKSEAARANEAHEETKPSPKAKPEGPRSVWEVLDLPPSASAEEVKRAYRKKALETHPDRGGNEAAFREVQRAYELAFERKTKAEARPKRR